MQNIIRNVYDRVRSKLLSRDTNDSLHTTGGTMNQYTTYTGTFTKRNGQARTMTFVKGADIPQSFRGTGKPPRLSQGEEVVYDINANGYRVFNHNTIQGQITESNVKYSFDKIS